MTETTRGDLRPPEADGDEKTTLLTFLDYLREAVVAKLDGLDDETAKRALVPSETSLLWLVKHLTAVELSWFVWAYAGEDITVADHHDRLSDSDTVGVVVADYRGAVARANEVIAATDDLDQPGVRSLRDAPPPNLRWILVHMIEETARHAGHADILREQLDGAVGR
jgi:hypothetical protein